MAKHSKRHNIRHKKALTDAKKSNIYAKVAKIIEIAARKGIDPSMNPSLETALTKARYNSLPKEVIEKAIKKWAGQTSGESFEEILYEWYGPTGSALLVKVLTSNRNRSAASIKLLFNKYGGSQAAPGAVARQFVEVGQIVIDGVVLHSTHHGKSKEEIWPYDIDQLEMDAIQRWADDIMVDDGMVTIICSRDDFVWLSRGLEWSGYHIVSAELVYLCDTTVSLSDDEYTRFELLVEMLEDNDDVDSVWHNVEYSKKSI